MPTPPMNPESRAGATPAGGTARTTRSAKGGFRSIPSPSIADLMRHAVAKKGNKLGASATQFESLRQEAQRLSTDDWAALARPYSRQDLALALPTFSRLFAQRRKQDRRVMRPVLTAVLEAILGPTHRPLIDVLLSSKDEACIRATINALFDAFLSPEAPEDSTPAVDEASADALDCASLIGGITGVLVLATAEQRSTDAVIDLMSPVLERLHPPSAAEEHAAIEALLKPTSWQALAVCEQSFRHRLELETGRTTRASTTNATLRRELSERDALITEHRKEIDRLHGQVEDLRREIGSMQQANVDQGLLHDADLHSARGDVIRLIRRELPLLEKAHSAATQPTPRIHVVVDHLERVIEAMSTRLAEIEGPRAS